MLVRCDFCMFGGRRLKKTALLSNNHLTHALAVQCDGQHEHLPWGVVEGEFATKQESTYTDLFCRTFVLTLTRHLRELGWKDERDVHGSHEHGPAAAKAAPDIPGQSLGRPLQPITPLQPIGQPTKEDLQHGGYRHGTLTALDGRRPGI